MLGADEAGPARADQFASTSCNHVCNVAKAAVHRYDYVPLLAFHVLGKGFFGEGVAVYVAVGLGDVVRLMEAAMIHGDLVATVEKPLNDQWPSGARAADN